MMRAARTPSRSALALLRAQQCSIVRQHCNIIHSRSLSVLPWRRKPPVQPIPVYFAKPAPKAKNGSFGRRLGRTAVTIFIYYMCLQVFLSVVIDPLLDWVEVEWSEMSDKEKEEMEREADERAPLLFLPCPFTTEAIAQPPYKGSDPEWKEFLSVNKDAELQDRMKAQLAELIRRNIEKNSTYHRILGSNKISINKYWLDIIYPVRPPPIYHVSGLMLMEDGLFWGPQPMDAMAAESLDKVFYPKAVAVAAWTLVSVLTKQTVAGISHALGMSSPEDERAMSPNEQRRFDAFKAKREGVWKSASEVVDNVVLHTTFQTMAALQKNWSHTMHPPTRGCIRVDGIVEVKGPSAIMSVWVLGWYDPKQRKYISLHTRLKHLIPRVQRPARN